MTETILLKMVRHVHALTGLTDLCLAGGVALNCVANGVILREGPFERLWVQPAAGDAGGALGVALLIHHQLLENPRIPNPARRAGRVASLARGYSDAQMERFLRSVGAPFERVEDDDALMRGCRRAPGRGRGRRLVPGSDGVRPPVARFEEPARRRLATPRCRRP